MIPFHDLAPLHEPLRAELQLAVQRVMSRHTYILGPEVEAFESEFASYLGANYVVGVATGTDAIELALRAAGIGAGDEVITVSHTAVATVSAIERAGATAVLVDVDPDTMTMSPDAVASALTWRTRVLLPVHLYGRPAEMGKLADLAEKHHLLVIEDCAQAHGATWDGRKVGTIGQMGAFSFYPTKNLGALGDGGAVCTNDAHLADRLRRLRQYGQSQRWHHTEAGINSRLDEMQAAILRVKLPHLDDYNQVRRELASLYGRWLRGVQIPARCQDGESNHVYHLYVITHPERDRLRAELARRGIDASIHYPVPIHLQPAYQRLGYEAGSLPVTEQLAWEVLSLPLYVGLPPHMVRTVCQAIEEVTAEVAHAKSA